MMKLLLLFCLFALGGVSFAGDMELVMELLNRAIQQRVEFFYDFGDDGALLSGRSTIGIYEPIRMLTSNLSATGDNKCTFHLQLPAGFSIDSQMTGYSEIVLDYCEVEVECIIDYTLLKPLSVNVSICDNVHYVNGTAVPDTDKYLPLLSQALFTKAQDVIEHESKDNLLDIPAISQLFGYFVQRELQSLPAH